MSQDIVFSLACRASTRRCLEIAASCHNAESTPVFARPQAVRFVRLRFPGLVAAGASVSPGPLWPTSRLPYSVAIEP